MIASFPKIPGGGGGAGNEAIIMRSQTGQDNKVYKTRQDKYTWHDSINIKRLTQGF